MSANKFISTVFLLCVFALHTISIAVPGWYAGGKQLVENTCSTEEEPSKGSEKTGSELKEFGIHNIYPGSLPTVFFVEGKIKTPLEAINKKDIHLAVFTPPPEFA